MSRVSKLVYAKARFQLLIEKFRDEVRGVAAVEFAIIAPILILMFIGTLEVSRAVAVNRKVSRISSAMADLITQSPSLTADEIQNIMDITSRIMFPYDETVEIVTTGITVSGTTPKVDWSCAEGVGATANVKGTIYSVPTSIVEDGAYFVSAKVTVDLKPMVGWMGYTSATGLTKDSTSVLAMEEELFLRPRTGTLVEIGDSPKCIN